MQALLRVISGPNAGACFVLEGRTRFGRAADADIQLDEPDVSRHHARIRREPDGRFELSDLGSTAGTTVNGASVRKKILEPDDVIAIGRSRFAFELATGTSTDVSFSDKVRGFATLRPTVPMPAVPVASSVPTSQQPPAKRKRRRTTQRRIPAMRDALPLGKRPQPSSSRSRRPEVAPPMPRTHPLGTPRGTPLAESGSVTAEGKPQGLDAALSTLRDVLEYRALRLEGLRGRPMNTKAAARYAQLTTRLLAETHGLPSSRRFVRERCPLPATLTQSAGEMSRTLEVSLDDLSAGGTRLTMFDPSVRVGDEVWVAFDLASLFSFGQKVVFRSRVVWTSGSIGATGLMFGGNAHFVDTVEAAIATG